jgi:hypothetical protein
VPTGGLCHPRYSRARTRHALRAKDPPSGVSWQTAMSSPRRTRCCRRHRPSIRGRQLPPAPARLDLERHAGRDHPPHLDGSTPTTSSPTYSGSLLIALTTTVKAIAVKPGWSQSVVGSAPTAFCCRHAGRAAARSRTCSSMTITVIAVDEAVPPCASYRRPNREHAASATPRCVRSVVVLVGARSRQASRSTARKREARARSGCPRRRDRRPICPFRRHAADASGPPRALDV